MKKLINDLKKYCQILIYCVTTFLIKLMY